MVKVNNFSFSKLTNVYHVSMNSSVFNMIEAMGASKLGLSEATVNAYKLAIDQEQDLVNRTTGSDKTGVINQYDAERSNLLRYVLNVLSNAKFSNDKTLAEAVQTIDSKILAKYGLNIVREATQKKTALIRGFVLDVEQFLHSYIGKLGIEKALSDLTTVNEAYQTTYLSRVSEQSASSKNSKEFRMRTEALYDKVVACVNFYASLDNAVDEDSMQRHSASLEFIQSLNMLQKRIRQSIKAGIALSNVNEPGNSESGNTPGGSNTTPGGNTNGGGLSDLG